MKKETLVIKLISMLIDDEDRSESNEKPAIGKYVIVRSRNEGVNFGKLVDYDSNCVHITECQRLHYFAPAEEHDAWYEGVANSGISGDSRISMESEKMIFEDYSLTFCTDVCVKSIKGHAPHGKK